MRFAVRQFVFGLLVSMFFAGPASAQYMKITTDNPTDNTRMRASGTTILTITLDTNHDKNGLPQTCNSHSAANCGALATANPLDMFSYTLALKAVGGTVTWGTFSASDAAYTDTSPQIQSSTEVEINKSRPTGSFTPPGLATIGTLPVTVVSGSPGVQVQIGASTINPFGFGSGFGTECDGNTFPNTYVVGDPTDPCGLTNGIPGDWFDWDGALSSSGNTPPAIGAPATASGAENTAIATITATATDPDAGNTLTITQTGMPGFLTFSSVPGPSPNIATIFGTPGFSGAGTYNINWLVNDGAGGTNNTSTQLTIANTDRAPTLTQPANMTVNEGSTAEQTLTASDPDADPLTFQIVSGPPYMTIGATTGIVRLVPDFTQSGTSTATARATDGTLFDDKSFMITVNNVNRAPILAQPANMSVTEGATADQIVTGLDPDGDALIFTKTAGPSFLTVTTSTVTSGNVHLAPLTGDAAGSPYSATVTATDPGALSNAKTFQITVVAGANLPPTLNQPANMTVNEGAIADQAITGSDPESTPLTFSKVAGPTFMTVSDTNPTTGNVHLAPGFSDSGTVAATVSASDGLLSDSKSLTITVNNVNRGPTLDAIADMTVTEGNTAEQTVSATDPDGDALQFTKVTGPTFMTVSLSLGVVHVAPATGDAAGSPYSASVSASDGTLSDTKSFSIAVNRAANQAPTLTQPVSMTVDENLTADQTLTATDPDGNALSFAKAAGPAFVTVTTTTPGTGTATGNIHLAPGFSDAGTYGATVSASDGSLSDSKSLTITVNNVDRGPTLTQPANMSVAQGATADQVLTGSDPDGDALTFSKVAGPTFMTVTTTNATTGNIHLAPGPSEPVGTSAASVRTTDGTLNSATEPLTVTVTATNLAPTLTQPADMTVDENLTADQTLTATDPDGNALSFAKAAGPAFVTVTTTTPGTGTATGNIHLAPGFSDAGTYGATVSASDGSLSDSKSLTITVNNVNRGPTLDAIANMTVTEGNTAEQTLSATDPDGDALQFTKVTGPTFMTVSLSLGVVHVAPATGDAAGSPYSASVSASDGTLSDTKGFTITVNPASAGNVAPVLAQPADMIVDEGLTADQTLTATDADGNALSFAKAAGPAFVTVTTTTPGTGTATGNIHLAPGFSDAGTYGATVSASDGSLSDSKSLTITVNNVNRGPTLDAIANMTVTEGVTADQIITGSDPDGDALSFAKVTGPGFMTVSTTNATSGNIHLAPVSGDAAGSPYSASASASDGTLSDTRSFTITVNAAGADQAPAVTAPASIRGEEKGVIAFTVSATDPDGDAITSFTANLSGLPEGNDASFTPGGANTTGSFAWHPKTGDAGSYSVTFTASNALSGSATTSLGVDPAGTGVTGELAWTPQTGDEGVYDVVFTATDPSATGGTSTFTSTITIQSGSSAARPAAPRAAQAPQAPQKGPIISGTSTVTGTPGSIVTVSVYATPDPTSGISASRSLRVRLISATPRAVQGITLTADLSQLPAGNNAAFSIVNQAPILNAIANMTVTEGATGDQIITASDPEGNPLTFAKVTGPGFMTVSTTNATTGNIHLAPATGDAAGSPYSASASASDGTLSDTKGFSVTVNAAGGGNQAPTLTQPTNMTVDEGLTADQTLNASDPDGDALTFAKVNGPTFMTVSTSTSTTGTVHLAPDFADAGTYGATVSASDGSLNDEKSFTITVNNANRPPSANAGGPYTGVVGVPVNFNGSGSTDPDGDPLTYSWDFDSTDGITADATGPTPSHAYSAPGSFTVTLTVADDHVPPATATATATATITESGGFQANAFLSGGDRIIKLNTGRPFWCVELEPVGRTFRLTDVIPSTILASFAGVSIHAIGAERILVEDEEDGTARLKVCFDKDSLRVLFASLPDGWRTANVTITGDLSGGGSFVASVSVVVVKGVPAGLAKGNEDGDGHDIHASPNPLNPSTVISFELSKPGSVKLNVYDVSGRLVKTLADRFMGSGVQFVDWDGTSRTGSRVASGVYFCVLQTSEGTLKSQLVVAK